jgi:hypothetical protein
MSQQRLSLSLSQRAERRARAMGRKTGSVSAYVERLIEEDQRRDQLRRFIDEHFAEQTPSEAALRQVRDELGLSG